jgi:hypothetical protein
MNPRKLKEDGFKHLDRVIALCANEGIYTVLDLHTAPGGQNHVSVIQHMPSISTFSCCRTGTRTIQPTMPLCGITGIFRIGLYGFGKNLLSITRTMLGSQVTTCSTSLVIHSTLELSTCTIASMWQSARSTQITLSFLTAIHLLQISLNLGTHMKIGITLLIRFMITPFTDSPPLGRYIQVPKPRKPDSPDPLKRNVLGWLRGDFAFGMENGGQSMRGSSTMDNKRIRLTKQDIAYSKISSRFMIRCVYNLYTTFFIL